MTIKKWWQKTDELSKLLNKKEDLSREGIRETPDRFIKSWEYLLSGYDHSPSDILTVFDAEGYNQLILLKNIEIYSVCEHHLMPFFGTAHIGYIPKEKVVGISKLARIADIFARRLQIQERLTDQITTAIMDYVNPLGACCVIEADHLCMRMRGVEKQNSIMVTSSMKGIFLTDDAARREFLQLIK